MSLCIAPFYDGGTGENRDAVLIETIANLLGGLPREGVIALLVLLSFQVILQLLALVDLARRRTVRGGRKWVWAVVILVGNLPGAVAYLAAGRMPDVVEPGPGTAHDDAGATSRDALDRLYGSRSGEEPR